MSVRLHGICDKCHRYAVTVQSATCSQQFCSRCSGIFIDLEKIVHLYKWQNFVRTVDAEIQSVKDRLKTP